MPVSSPRVCPVLIGRESELATLTRLLDDARRGRCQLAIVAGEAGAGKTRLVRELLPPATAAGFQLLIGACTERDRAFPFAPVVDALRQRLAATAGDHRAFLGPQGAVAADLLPELRSDYRSASEGLPLPPEQGKRRLFEAVVALLDRLADRQPLLLVLEDLHWADPTSLELLQLLPRRLVAARLLILGTVRTDEPNADLSHCLAALRRARSVVELSVEPLSDQGVAGMLEIMLRVPPATPLVAAVYARTDGNPFFVEELLATVPAGAGTGWLIGEGTVPGTVRDAVLRRLEGLGPVAQAVADLAAVAGQRVSFDLLLAASGLTQDDLLAAIQTLIDRQFLVEERLSGRPRLAFRHALTRDALHDRLLTPRRRSLHRVVAEALEAMPHADQAFTAAAGDLGYHFHAAEVWNKALAYATRAGEAAWSVHATMEAMVHYQRALDAALALADPWAAELHRRCGQTLALLGAFDAARRHLDEALQLARSRNAAVEQAALYDLAGLYASRDYLAAERLAEKALALARAGGDRQREGLALNRLGNVLTNLTRFAEGRALHEDALVRFDGLGDRWGSADCLDLIGMSRYLAGEMPEARDAFGRAAAMFAELGDTERVASALTSRGLYLAVLDGPCAADAAPAAFRADAEQGLRLCREIGWRAGEAYALVALACADLGEGRYREAWRHAATALAIAEEIDHQQWMVIASLTVGLLHADILGDARALEGFERALAIARTVGSAQWVERLEAWIGYCRVRLGDAGAGLATLQRLLPSGSQPATIGQRRALFGLAEHARVTGRLDQALALADRLLVGAAGPRPAGAVLLRANVLAALGRNDEADAGYQDARRLATELGPRSVLWRAAAGRARLWRERDPGLTDREARTARAEVAALAEAIPEEEWRAAFLRAAEVRPWTAPAGRRRTADTPRLGGLTPREREVAASVAQGLSNKEIARALSVAEKTVEMHVGSCLGKLGFASRTQLAGWAIAQGLAPAPQPQG